MGVKIYLKRGKAGPTIGRHPWLFGSAIESIEGSPQDGDEVSVFKIEDGQFLAKGLYNSQSQIRARLYSWNSDDKLDARFWESRIQRAIELRRQCLGFKTSDSMRLVFSESDFVSGLIVDRLGDCLSVQISSLALHQRRNELLEILQRLENPKGMLVKVDHSVSKQEGLFAEDEIRNDLPESEFQIEENGLKYWVSLRGGQKTGYYLDQKFNRQAAASMSQGKKVLDLFSYSGGFSMACARAGAASVTAVDSSESAIDLARRSAASNGLSSIEFVAADVFDFIRSRPAERYDLVIVDPPRLASNRKFKNNALRKYFKTNEEALKLVKPGGFLFTFSCSGLISRDEFFSMLSSVGRRSKRDIQVVEQRGASPDHPVSAACPESSYLKCIVARVY